MTNNEKEQRRRRRVAKPSVSFVTSDYAMPKHDENDVWWMPEYYYQISNTMGLKEIYDHPELEAYITFDVDFGGYSILKYLCNTIEKGARYKAGDRVEIPPTNNFFLEPLGQDLPKELAGHSNRYTVEFIESKNCYGPCLRAVVVGVEEELQALSNDEAYRWLCAHGPLIDPYKDL